MSGSCFRTLAVILVLRLMQMIISVAMYKQSNPIGFRKEKKKGITKKQKQKKQKNEAKKRGNMLNWPSHWLALVGPVQQTTYGMHDCSQGCTLDKEQKIRAGTQIHSCQPLLGVNLSLVCEPVFPLCRLGYFVFSLVPGAFWIPIGTCGSGRKKQCCAKYACTTSDLTSDEIS